MYSLIHIAIHYIMDALGSNTSQLRYYRLFVCLSARYNHNNKLYPIGYILYIYAHD